VLTDTVLIKTVTVKYNIKTMNRGFLDISTYKYELMVFEIFFNRKSLWINTKEICKYEIYLPIYVFKKLQV
jgi:hypothetical protein